MHALPTTPAARASWIRRPIVVWMSVLLTVLFIVAYPTIVYGRRYYAIEQLHAAGCAMQRTVDDIGIYELRTFEPRSVAGTVTGRLALTMFGVKGIALNSRETWLIRDRAERRRLSGYLAWFPELERVENIDIRSDEDTLHDLRNCRCLKCIWFAESTVTDASVGPLLTHSHLEYLAFANGSFKGESLSKITRLPRLKLLDLRSTRDFGEFRVTDVMQSTSLESVLIKEDDRKLLKYDSWRVTLEPRIHVKVEQPLRCN